VTLIPHDFLQTERLSFRRWSPEDLPLARTLWGDLQVTRFLGAPFSEEAIQRRLDLELANENTHQVQYWPIFLNSNAEFVGCAGLRPYQPDQKIYELGYHLRPDYWGKGLATEAATAAVTYAFQTLKASALFAAHYPGNTASGHVLKKLGFQFTHEELYAPTGAIHRAYLLIKPA
jgi:[ribosomal protein S5]-alanine N-acetyltransferase